jgi:threonylcarbamoyladenosine tRNA methylthiotransferase MtaB
MATIPDLALTTDVMVGFPGETEADFNASVALVEELDFAQLHVFRFSPRPGTAAARMAGRVDRTTVRARSHALRQLGAEKQRRYRERFCGRTLPVLWESLRERKDGSHWWQGYTDNYIPVVTASSSDLQNRITRTRLVSVRRDHLEGVVELEGSQHG